MTSGELLPPQIETDRLILRMPQADEAEAPLRYFTKNKDHLADSAPSYAEEFFTETFWKDNLTRHIEQFQLDQNMRLFIYEKTADGGFGRDIIGSVNLNEIVRRAAQFCYLGYGLDRDKVGHGLMSEAVAAVVRFGFNELNLHRIMANYVPTNTRSGAVLKRVGFVEEGFARAYLFLNGQWRDHVLTSITNPNWQSDRA
jgi:ribosomal-protein-alanine N-acetyltransferase